MSGIAIRALVAEMPIGQIFTSSDLLSLGSRASIDNCLKRLVDKGKLMRLARGVFTKGDKIPHITPLELAKIKARAFKKEVFEHASTTAQRLGYVQGEQPRHREPVTFATNGAGSSSFQSVFGTIHLKATSARKRQPDRNEVWEMLKSLWHMRNDDIPPKIRNRIMQVWGRQSQASLQMYCGSIPQWLREQFQHDWKSALKALRPMLIPQTQTQTIRDPDKNAQQACSCPPDDPDCICPDFTCAYCQSKPIRNRFSIALG